MGADRVYNLIVEDSFIKESIEYATFSLNNEKPVELVEIVGEIVKRCFGSLKTTRLCTSYQNQCG